MAEFIRKTDAKARVKLPKAFASCTVMIEQLSDTELRVRIAKVVPLDEWPFELADRPAAGRASALRRGVRVLAADCPGLRLRAC